MSDPLEEVWTSFCSHYELPCEVNEKWLKVIRGNYECQKCFDVQYLNAKLRHFQNCTEKLSQPYSVSAALIFQSIQYDTQSSENTEKCIEKFKEFVAESGLGQDGNGKGTGLTEEVCNLIELSTTSSTEEHKTEGVFGTSDQHYFLDINFTNLAADWDDYMGFAEKTRSEYDFLSETAYKSLRLKVLQSFLLIPNIFATQEFREKFEAQARANIQKEITQIQ